MTELTQPEWDHFVTTAPHGSFLQSWAWGQMQERLPTKIWRLVMHENDAVAAVSLVIERPLPLGRSWLYIPHGPVGKDDTLPDGVWQDWQRQLQEVAQQTDALFVRADPMWAVEGAGALREHGWVKADRDVQPRHTVVIDLTRPLPDVLESFHHKTRYNIRLAQKRGVSVRFSRDESDLASFLKITREVQDRSPFRYHPEHYYRVMQQVLAPAGIYELALAEYEGRVLAAHIILTFGKTATYAHGASSSHQRQVMAPYLLQWAAMQRAHEQAVTHYDLFGVAAPQAPPSHTWAGITRFKSGFNGTRLSFVGAYDFVQDTTWYSGLQLVKRLRTLWH